METRVPTFRELAFKTVVVHTVTYFLMGVAALTVFHYTQAFSQPELHGLMRGTDDAIVRAGPLFQPLRGVVFALAFYPLREVLFARRNGWLTIWLLLVSLGIISTFGPSPGSIEGLIYTTLPLDRHFGGMIEILGQSCLFSWLLHHWVRHPGNRWLNWPLITAFVLVMVLPALGLVALKLLPSA